VILIQQGEKGISLCIGGYHSIHIHLQGCW